MIVWLVIVLGILYLLLLLGVAYCFVFPFRTPIFISPGFLGVPQEWIEFEDSGTGRLLRGWWVPKEDPEVVMVCAHGYMMNRAELAPFAPRFQNWPIAFLFFDLPAHGASRGRKSGFGYKERTAVASAVAEAKRRYPNAKIVLAGSSMGAAASAFALAESPNLADALILDSCYDRLVEAITGWWLFIGGKTLQYVLYPASFFGMPLSGVNPFRIVVSSALAKIAKPTLILHGGADTLAPPSAAKTNFDALAGPKSMVIFDGRNHSEARWEEPDRYFEAIEAFLQENGLADHRSK
ncbi:MAG: alpha/beta fold hydrolase [Armatimonadetes bacterium]|nr:alpha/beta fold hydrolase [Armatimonadota bacterium]